MHNKQQITGWLFLLLLCVAGCGQPVSKKQNTMINWTKLPDLPGAADTASLGVSAPFAGIHNGVLIVAGGCNFPDKPVTEGGAKRYYSEIFVLLPEGWKEIDRLPRPVAYGATVSTPEGIVCIGGNNSDSSLVEVSRISYNPTKGEVAVCALPSLPSPMDNLSAAFTGQEIYVAGGNENGQPCHTFLRLNLANIEKGWEQLPDFPGAARVQPVLAAGESPNGTRIYLAGGFQPILNEEEPIVPTDVLVFDPATFTWQQETVLPPFKDGTNRTLTGGCAVTFQNLIYGRCELRLFLSRHRPTDPFSESGGGARFSGHYPPASGSQGLYAPSGRMVPIQYHLTSIRPIHESMERSGRI